MRVLDWVKKQGVVLLAGRGPCPNLAEEVAGEKIKGSWWGHAKGKQIFAASNEVAECPDVLVCKLVDDKVTFVHRRLWPALIRLRKEIGVKKLARVTQKHTEDGKHVNEVVPFEKWVTKDLLKAADALDEDEARQALGVLLGVSE